MTALLSLTLALIGASQPEACTLGAATYSDRSGSGYTITFEPTTTALPLIVVRSAPTGTTYRFSIHQGNGYAAALLQPWPASLGPVNVQITIYTIDADLGVRGGFPGLAAPAPTYLFAPELGQALWYGAEALGGPTLAAGREALPRTFFERVGCD